MYSSSWQPDSPQYLRRGARHVSPFSANLGHQPAGGPSAATDTPQRTYDRENIAIMHWQRRSRGSQKGIQLQTSGGTYVRPEPAPSAPPARLTRTLQAREWKVISSSGLFVFVDAQSGNDSTCTPCRTVSAAVDVAWSTAASSAWWGQPAVVFVPGQPARQAPRTYIIVNHAPVNSTGAFAAESPAVLSAAVHGSAVLPHLSVHCLPADEFAHVHNMYRFVAAERVRASSTNVQCAAVGQWLTGSPQTGAVAASSVTAIAALVNSGFSQGLRLQTSTVTAGSGNAAAIAYVSSELYAWVRGLGAEFVDSKYGVGTMLCAWDSGLSNAAVALTAARSHTVEFPTGVTALDSPLHILESNGLLPISAVPFAVSASSPGDACASPASYALLYVNLPLSFPSPDEATVMLGLPHELSGLVFLNPTQCALGVVQGMLRDAAGDLDGFGPMLVSSNPGLPFANSITLELSGFVFGPRPPAASLWGATSPAVLQALGLDSVDQSSLPSSPVIVHGAVSLCATRVRVQGSVSTSSGGWLSAGAGAGAAIFQLSTENTISHDSGGVLSVTDASTVVLGQSTLSTAAAAGNGGAVSVSTGARFLTTGALAQASGSVQLAITSAVAGQAGGGVFCSTGAACLVRQTSFSLCSARVGGSIAAHDNSLIRTNMTHVFDGYASIAGGAVSVERGSAINDTQSVWRNCSAPEGGILDAASSDAAVILFGTQLFGVGPMQLARRPLVGGCVHLADSVAAWLTSTRLQDCFAGTAGAIHAHSAVRLSVVDSSITHSGCSNAVCSGGAIWAHGQAQVMLLRSELRHCHAMTSEGKGGCIAAGTDTVLELVHSVVSSGSAYISGGCVAATSGRALLKLFNTTITDCQAGGELDGLSSTGSGGCIFSAGGSVQLLGANTISMCSAMSSPGRGGDGGGVAIIAGGAQNSSEGLAAFSPSLIVPACPVVCSLLQPGDACTAPPPSTTSAFSEWATAEHPGDENANVISHSFSARGGGLYIAGTFLFVNGSQCFPWSAIQVDSAAAPSVSGSLLLTQADGVSPAVVHFQRRQCIFHPDLPQPACTVGSGAGFTAGFLAGPFAAVVLENSASSAGGGVLVGQDDIRAGGEDSDSRVLSSLIASWMWVEGNVCDYVGGGISAGPFALMRLQFARLAFNRAENGGGALVYMGLSHPLNALHGLDVVRNSAGQGGGISWASGYHTQGNNAQQATELPATDLDRPFISDTDEISKNSPLHSPTYTTSELETDIMPYSTEAYISFVTDLVQETGPSWPPGMPARRPMFNIELARDGLSSRLALIRNRGDAAGGGIAMFNRVQMRIVGARLAVKTDLADKLLALNLFPRVREFERTEERVCDNTNPSASYNSNLDFRPPAWWLALPQYNQVTWPQRFITEWLPRNRTTHGFPHPDSTYAMRTARSRASPAQIAGLALSQVVNSFSWKTGLFDSDASDFIQLPKMVSPSILLPVATFIGNSAPNGGGADVLCAELAGCTVEGVISSQSRARFGGVFALSADIFGRLGHSVVQYATAGSQGGVAYSAARSNLTMTAVSSQCSRCGVQGCIAFATAGQIKLSDSVFSDSISRGGAAGLYVTGVDNHVFRVTTGRLQLQRTTFALMKGGSDGIGAIQYDATGTGWMHEMAMYRSFTSGSNGGTVLYCRGTEAGATQLAISNILTYWTRAVPGGGGAVLVDDFCDLTITNSTFSTAAAQFGGGVLAVAGTHARVAMHGFVSMHDCENSEIGGAISVSGQQASLEVYSPDSVGGLAIENCKAALSGAALAVRPTARTVIAEGASINIRNTTAIGGGALFLSGSLSSAQSTQPEAPRLDVHGKLVFFDITSTHTSSFGVGLFASASAVLNVHSGATLNCTRLHNSFSGACLLLDGDAVAGSFSGALLVVEKCQAVEGPGIYLQNGAKLAFTNQSTVHSRNNTAVTNGGFAAVSGATLNSSDSGWSIQHSSAGSAGGAFYIAAGTRGLSQCDPGFDFCSDFLLSYSAEQPGTVGFHCSENTAETGGCIYAEASQQFSGEVSIVTVSLSDQRSNVQGFTFRANRATASAGNAASGFGGAVGLGSAVRAFFSGIDARSNIAANGGGVLASLGADSRLAILRSSLSSNSVAPQGSGGAVLVAGSGGQLQLSQIEAKGNRATVTGGFLAVTGTATVHLVDVTAEANSLLPHSASSCTAAQCGGAAVAITGLCPLVEIKRSVVQLNHMSATDSEGGGLLISGPSHLDLNGVSILDNTAPVGRGGGLFVSDVQRLVISGPVLVSNNSASSAGGAFLRSGAVSMCLDASAADAASAKSFVAGDARSFPTIWRLPSHLTNCSVSITGNRAVSSLRAGAGETGGLLLDRVALHGVNATVTGNTAESFAGMRILGFNPQVDPLSPPSIVLVGASIVRNRATCSRPGLTCGASEQQASAQRTIVSLVETQLEQNVADQVANQLACSEQTCFVGEWELGSDWAAMSFPEPPNACAAVKTTTYLVDQSSQVETQCCGSEFRPCRTLEAAIQASLPGDEISVSAGVYSGPGNENLTISSSTVIKGHSSNSEVVYVMLPALDVEALQRGIEGAEPNARVISSAVLAEQQVSNPSQKALGFRCTSNAGGSGSSAFWVDMSAPVPVVDVFMPLRDLLPMCGGGAVLVALAPGGEWDADQTIIRHTLGDGLFRVRGTSNPTLRLSGLQLQSAHDPLGPAAVSPQKPMLVCSSAESPANQPALSLDSVSVWHLGPALSRGTALPFVNATNCKVSFGRSAASSANSDSSPAIQASASSEVTFSDYALLGWGSRDTAVLRVDSGSTLRIANSSFAAVTSTMRSPILMHDSKGLMEDSIMLHNEAGSNGGGCFTLQGSALEVRATLRNASFIENKAGASGGAMHLILESNVLMTSVGPAFVSLRRNSAFSGGAVSALGESAVLFSGAVDVSDNTAQAYGGAIYSEKSSLEFSCHSAASVVNGCVQPQVTANSAQIDGGAVFALLSSVRASDTSFTSNSAVRGGGIACILSSIHGNRTVFSNNAASADGAAMDLRTGDTAVLNSCTVEHNIAAGSGGAISANAPQVLHTTTSSFVHNSAVSGRGGAIAITASKASDASFSGTQFKYNSAGELGGAIYAVNTGSSSTECAAAAAVSASLASVGGATLSHVQATASAITIFIRSATGGLTALTLPKDGSGGSNGAFASWGGLLAGCAALASGEPPLQSTAAQPGPRAPWDASMLRLRFENRTDFQGNSAADTGGAVYASGAALLLHGAVSLLGNAAGSTAGGFYLGRGAVGLIAAAGDRGLNGSMSGNMAGSSGSALFADATSTATLQNVVVSGNCVPASLQVPAVSCLGVPEQSQWLCNLRERCALSKASLKLVDSGHTTGDGDSGISADDQYADTKLGGAVLSEAQGDSFASMTMVLTSVHSNIGGGVVAAGVAQSFLGDLSTAALPATGTNLELWQATVQPIIGGLTMRAESVTNNVVVTELLQQQSAEVRALGSIQGVFGEQAGSPRQAQLHAQQPSSGTVVAADGRLVIQRNLVLTGSDSTPAGSAPLPVVARAQGPTVALRLGGSAAHASQLQETSVPQAACASLFGPLNQQELAARGLCASSRNSSSSSRAQQCLQAGQPIPARLGTTLEFIDANGNRAFGESIPQTIQLGVTLPCVPPGSILRPGSALAADPALRVSRATGSASLTGLVLISVTPFWALVSVQATAASAVLRNALITFPLSPCPAGQGWSQGDCTDCVVGQVSTADEYACSPCPGNQVPQVLPSGVVSGSACRPCPAGQVPDPERPGSCARCLPGTQPTADGSACEQCEVGAASPLGEQCRTCPPGYLAPSTGSVACSACAPGLYSLPTVQRIDPDPPSTGPPQWVVSGAASCSACSSLAATCEQGALRLRENLFVPDLTRGTALRPDSLEVAQGTNLVLLSHAANSSSLPYGERDCGLDAACFAWQLRVLRSIAFGKENIHICIGTDACAPVVDDQAQLSGNNSSAAEGAAAAASTSLALGIRCGDGREGPLCAACSPEGGSGDGYVRMGDNCTECSSGGMQVFLLLLVTLALVVLLSYSALFLRSSDENNEQQVLFKIFINHLQVLATQTSVALTAQLTAVAQVWSDVGEVSGGGVFSLSPMRCYFKQQWAALHSLQLISPFMMLLFVALLQVLFVHFGCWRFAVKREETLPDEAGGAGKPNLGVTSNPMAEASVSNVPPGTGEGAVPKASRKSRRRSVVAVQRGNALVVERHFLCGAELPWRLQSWEELWRNGGIVAPLVFVSLVTYNSLLQAGLVALRCTDRVQGSFWLVADTSVACSGPAYAMLSALSGLAVALVALAMPVAVVLVLRPHKAKLSSPRIFQRYGMLYGGYRPSRWYWESVIMLRKVAVQIIASLLTVSGLRLVALLLVMGLCVLAQAKLKPYTRSTLNRLEMLSLGSLLLSLVLEVAVLAATGLSDNAAALDSSLQTLKNAQVPVAVAIIVLQLGVVATLLMFLVRSSLQKVQDALLSRGGCGHAGVAVGKARGSRGRNALAVELASKRRTSMGLQRKLRPTSNPTVLQSVRELPDGKGGAVAATGAALGQSNPLHTAAARAGAPSMLQRQMGPGRAAHSSLAQLSPGSGQHGAAGSAAPRSSRIRTMQSEQSAGGVRLGPNIGV